MNERRVYSGFLRLIILPAPSKLLRFSLLLLTLLISFSYKALSQDQEYDEISVFLDVKGMGGYDIPAVIKGEELFLPVKDLFDLLRIRCDASAGLDSLYGSFINPEARYYINRVTNRIIYQEKVHLLNQGDLIRTESNLYLRASWLGKIFGLECVFNFRNLAVTVLSSLELPLIREMRLEQMRRNLTRLKGDIKADTILKRTYPGFRFGMADWSAIATEEINGKSETRLNLTLGSVIAGGETTVSLNYNSAQPFSEKQQHYLWRYVNNDFGPLRQVMAGKIATQAFSSIYNPVIGVQLTNTPTTFRRSFGSYTLSDRTEPGWIVELYVNNELVDYVKADASGFFSFQVPLVYGNSIVKLKFFGPWGEERIREQSISIPFNFIPAGTLEYTVSAGVVEDTLFSRFSKASINYGLSRSITVGTGIEYLSSVSSGPVMPFVKASFRIANNIMLAGEYAYGVRAAGTLSYRLPSNLQFDLNYKWYHKDQTAIKFNYREERKISASIPVKIGKFSSYNRLSVNQLVLPGSHYTSGEWLFSSSLLGVSTNLTTNGLFIGEIKPYFYSTLSVAARLPARIVIMPQLQYSYSDNKVLSVRLRAEKLLLDHAFLNASFERNFINNISLAEVGFRYDFSFAKTGVSVRQSGKRTTFVEHASGSLISDPKTRFMRADNRANVGRGGITVIPFIDINNNGIRDIGEQKVKGLNIRVNSGSVLYHEKDTTIRITGLEAYSTCFIELDQNSFDNISWRLSFRSASVAVDPNMLKTLYVPVEISGEANGTVMLDEEGSKRGIGRIIVTFLNEKNLFAGRTLTEDDGYFSLLGLTPGKYYVVIDTGQLGRLKMAAEPDSVMFTIRTDIDGDIVDGLDFILRKIPEEKPLQEIIQPKPVVKKDTVYMVIHEVVEELVTIAEDCYAIQLGAFRKRSNAESLQKKLQKIFGKNVEIVVADNYFKVRITDIKTRAEVDEKIEVLRRNGIYELWVITLRARQIQKILRERSDSVATIRDVIDSVAGKPITPPVLSLQTGAFRSNNYAQALKNKLSAMVSYPVEIIFEDGYYKVRITGFKTKDDIERLLPSLGMMGLRDLWVPPVKTPVVAPEPVRVDTLPRVPEVKIDTLPKVIEPLPEVKPEVKPEEIKKEIPMVSLRVGEFLKKSQAIRAQRKIKKKLDLDTSLEERWGYYYILIGGFWTREETYRYYPELAGIGLTKVSVVDLR